MYVADGYRNARVHRFAANGQLKASWGEPGKGGANQFHLPHSLIVGQDDRVYVCDRENSRIQVFSLEGQFITMWTDMQRPLDISQDKDGIFYTSERPENGKPPQMSVLDRDGKVLARWDKPNNAGAGQGAHALWVDSHGDLYVNQNLEGHRLLKYRKCG